MKKAILLLAVFLLTSCVNNTPDDPLIVPPHFAEVPDPANPEKLNEKRKDADIDKLKDLLLKSE